MSALAAPQITATLCERWARRRAVRSALSLAATAAYLVVLSRA